MINRMSSRGQHAAAIAQILKQQTQLSRTQVQLASGNRIQTAADDPIAATRILANERTQAQLSQYGRNADMAVQRLGYGEQALSDTGSLLDRVRVLAVQAGNGAMDDASLSAIAAEVRARAADLLQIANRQDANGEYLYAGFSSGTRPFTPLGGSTQYAGDQGVRQVQVSGSQQIADGFNGQRVFMDVPEGNGTFSVAAGVHAGTGVLGVTQVTNMGAWTTAANAAAAVPQAHSYTVRFIDPDANGTADSWEVLDAGGTQVATGAYNSDAAITFNGVQISVTGKPAVGDSYTIEPASAESLFTTVENLAAALERGAGSPEANARLATDLNLAIRQLDSALGHVNDLRAETGARLSALDAAASQREDLDYQLTESIGSLRDLDYAEAISRLNQQMSGLQAAQQAYTRIGQMSLFDYMR